MKVWKYGNDVNTDMLFPGKYTYTCATADEIRPHLLEDLDPSFAGSVRPGDIVMGGSNFGCGSSREQPVVGLKAAGVQAVIAKSFARIFYRSAINQGLLLVECPDAVDAFAGAEEVSLDVRGGKVVVGGRSFSFPPLPAEIIAIRDSGGLLEHVRARLSKGAP